MPRGATNWRKSLSCPTARPLRACLLLLGSVVLQAVSQESGAPERARAVRGCKFISDLSPPGTCAELMWGTSGKNACNYNLAGVEVSQDSPTSTTATSCVYSSGT